MQNALPQFDTPPAIETLMGFHFSPIGDLNTLRLGQFYDHVKHRYPGGRLADPVGALQDPPQVFAEVGTMPMRAILATTGNDELLQVQSSAFLRNWRRTPENEEYTHFSQLRPRFEKDWLEFTNFLNQNSISAPNVFQGEVTYVNHLLRGRDWESYSDLANLIKLFAARDKAENPGRRYGFLPEAANVALSVGYSLPERGLTLQMVAQSAITMAEGNEVLQLTITAKGAPLGTDFEALFDVLDRCHDAVIRGFDDVTTEYAHTLWGKR